MHSERFARDSIDLRKSKKPTNKKKTSSIFGRAITLGQTVKYNGEMKIMSDFCLYALCTCTLSYNLHAVIFCLACLVEALDQPHVQERISIHMHL